MLRSGLLVGTLAATAILTGGFGTPALAADAKAQITEMEHKCAAATNVDEAMACNDTSEDLVVYDIGTPREFDGPKAVHADLQNFFDNNKNPKVEFVSLHVVTDGTLGFASSIQHFTSTGKDGKPVDVTVRVTDVWRKIGGEWKIIHTHASYPVDLASGKADIQSKP